jgi:hypothetical protein
MIGVTLKELKVKWNSKAILTPAEKFQVKLLKEAGAYTRMIQRNSIKRAANRKDRSQPGQPPKHHGTPLLGGDGYKGTIFYDVDVRKKEMVCGAVLLQGTSANGQAVPGALEHGGVLLVLTGRRFARRKVAVDYRARPSAVPAFQKMIDKKLPRLIEGGIMREV